MTTETRRRIALVEDHVALSKGLVAILEAEGYAVAGEAGTAAEGYRLVGDTKPDGVVVDMRLPDESGCDLTRRLLRRDARLPVLIYTAGEDPAELADAFECGARGVVLKGAATESLVRALHAVVAGGTYLDPALRRSVLGDAAADDARVLSSREREILSLLARGMTGEEVAGRLSLSPETVRTHIRNAMRRLEARTRTHAIVLALQSEEIRLSGPVRRA